MYNVKRLKNICNFQGFQIMYLNYLVKRSSKVLRGQGVIVIQHLNERHSFVLKSTQETKTVWQRKGVKVVWAIPKNYSGVSHQEKSCRSVKILKKAREWKSSFSCLVFNSISCVHPLRETSLYSITNRQGSYDKKESVKRGSFPAPQRGRPLPVRDLWLLGHFLPGSQQQDPDGQKSAVRWLNKER